MLRYESPVNTQAALDIIKDSQSDYENVLKYIGVIKQGKSSGMWAYLNPPTFIVGRATYTSSPTWYASTIVHDAIHSRQYHQHLLQNGYVPRVVWTGFYAKMEALELQISFLIQINAPQREINWAESLRDEVWWDDLPSW